MTITAHLAQLERAGLIGAAAQPELAYFFRHGLIQDAAYSTLLKQQRRAWHQAAGEALEAALPTPETLEALDALAPVLAQHFSIAGDVPRALRYFARAADAAYARFANAEAGDYYAQALELATSGQAAYDPALVQRLSERYGHTLELRSQYEAALRHHERMEAVAQRHGDQALALAALLARATIYATANLSYDPERSRALLEQAAPLAEALGDKATQARLYWTLMLQNTMRGGDVEERIAQGERALAMARELDLREQLAYIHQDLWFAYGGIRPWETARATLLEAIRLWRELENPLGQCEAAVRLFIAAMVMGDYDEALALGAEADQLAQTIHSPDMQALSHAFVGLIHADRGDYAQAVAISENALSLGTPTGNVTVLVGTQADLGLAYGELGAVDRGLPLAQAALNLAKAEFPLLLGWAAAVLARLHLLRGDAAQAASILAELPSYQDWLRRAGFMAMMWLNVALAEGELALAQGQYARTAALMAEVAATLQATGVRFRLPDVLYLRGRALLAQGRLAQARSELQMARLEALALNSRRMLWRILGALADIEARSGQTDQAAALRRQARRLIEDIANHAPTPTLREAFLAQALVRALANDESG